MTNFTLLSQFCKIELDINSITMKSLSYLKFVEHIMSFDIGFISIFMVELVFFF